MNLTFTLIFDIRHNKLTTMDRSIRILIIDDEEIFLRIASLKLKKMGYEIITSHTAVNIFTIVGHCGPDIIIMDHDMPGITGANAIKMLKAESRYKSIPIIMLSQKDDVEEIARACGADAFLSKSAEDYEQLISMIEGMCK